MKRQFVSPVRLDHPVVMLARIHQQELERAAERQRLANLARAARPQDKSPLTVLVQWLRARRSAGCLAGQRAQPQPATGPARRIGCPGNRTHK